MTSLGPRIPDEWTHRDEAADWQESRNAKHPPPSYYNLGRKAPQADRFRKQGDYHFDATVSIVVCVML
jgi:hypothetical protein